MTCLESLFAILILGAIVLIAGISTGMTARNGTILFAVLFAIFYAFMLWRSARSKNGKAK